MTLLLAWRNLGRHRLRSGLTAGGIAVAVALIIWSTALMDAFSVEMVRAATATRLGDLQIHARAYVDEPALQNGFANDDALLQRIAATAGVAAATARLTTFGLVGHEKRSIVAWVSGVQPRGEAQVSDVDESLVAGHWFSAAPKGEPAEAILGEGVARLLSVSVGDELVILLQAADGSLGNEVLRVQGVVRTGSTDIDREAVYLRLADVQRIAALDGFAHELVVRAKPGADLDALLVRLQNELAQTHKELVVRTWQQLMPDLAHMVELSDVSMWIFYAIIYFIAALSILNAQRMSALERRREIGVMMAVGQTPRQTATMMLLETLLLTAMGTAVGVALGALATWYCSRFGLVLSAGDTGTSFTYAGVTFGERLFFHPQAKQLTTPAMVILLVGLVAGLWPALGTAGRDPARAISGRQ